MDLRINYGLPFSLPAGNTPIRPQETSDSTYENSLRGPYEGDLPFIAPSNSNSSAITRLISESREETNNGYRRAQTFEQADGRNFTRVEDASFTATGFRRSVIQQNPSGGITRYEEVLDREPSGNFRRTQRFQDEAGQNTTEVTLNYKVSDPFILTGGGKGIGFGETSRYAPLRGTQLDLTA